MLEGLHDLRIRYGFKQLNFRKQRPTRSRSENLALIEEAASTRSVDPQTQPALPH
jgi:hypothetical protein